jgi:hypothetical protein
MTRFRAASMLLSMSLVLLAPCTASAASDPVASAASSRVVRELAMNDWRMPSSSDSTGLSIDAVVLLAASGSGATAARSALDHIQADGPAWAASSPSSDQGRRAKLMYVLQVGGRNTGTLEAELRAAIEPDGRVGTGTNVFGQAWAIIALARTPGGVPPEAVTRLLTLQCTTGGNPQQGGFGFGACSTVDGDATGMAVAALLAAGRTAADPALTSALGWMQSHQLADGSFAMQLAPRSGNTNSTGLVGHGARQLGTPAGAVVADSAAAFIRELQVTCEAPLIAGDDPSVGGGFPRSWLGSIAYDAAAQDSVIASGVAPGRLTQWRYATLQAPLALPGMRALGTLTLDGATAGVEPMPTCAAPPVVPGGTTGDTTTLPATTFRVRTNTSRPVATGSRIKVTVTRLAPRERYTILLSDRIVARGAATASGTASRLLFVQRSLGSHPRRVLRVLGSTTRRTGSASVATAAPRRLFVVAPARPRSGSRMRIRVHGLLARESFRVTIDGRIVSRSFAVRSGTNYVTVPVRLATPRQRVTVCGVTCSRRGSATIQVRR